MENFSVGDTVIFLGDSGSQMVGLIVSIGGGKFGIDDGDRVQTVVEDAIMAVLG